MILPEYNSNAYSTPVLLDFFHISVHETYRLRKYFEESGKGFIILSLVSELHHKWSNWSIRRTGTLFSLSGFGANVI